ncbi:MAG: TolC family protein [Oscillospiraceae bacterium]
MYRRLLALSLCLVMALSLLQTGARAAERTLLLPQAQNLALAKSPEITKKSNQILLKQMKYVEAVKGIQAKVKNLRSFRWTPLLSFKLPQKLNLTEEFELNIKPLTLQTEIDTLRHALGDLRFAVLEEVNQLYTDLYVLQEKISFTAARLAAAEGELSRNRARLVLGDATQKDIDKMTASVEALTTELSTQKRSFESDKQKLSERIGLDVTSGYRFANSLKTLSLPRERLDWVIQYTMDHDQSFYETRMTASTALLNMNAYESLMRNQYGWKMGYIENFIQMARQGQDVDYAAFQLQYNAMLKQLDRPWSFTMRILSFRFTMEWFKGQIDGTRYIEDEIYAVYTACMEYAAAKREQDSAEKELRANVADSYEALVTGYNGYLALQKIAASAQKNNQTVSALNKLGKADYSEVKDARDNYEEMQLEMVDSLAAYNKQLYAFDRLTCGAITAYLSGGAAELDTGGGADSFQILDPITDPYYYIYTKVEDLTFHIGVSIPKDFEPAVSAFEVWIDGVQIGERTQTKDELSHLALDYQDGTAVTLRLYDSDKFVAECEIDAAVPRDILPIQAAKPRETVTEVPIGTYRIATAPMGDLSLSTLTLSLDPGNPAASYSLTFRDRGAVLTERHLPVEESFSYLSLLAKSVDQLSLTLYDKAGAERGKARFDPVTMEIMAEIPQ